MTDRIYLDFAATTPLLPEARDAMAPWLDHAGNPSSLHSEGRRAKGAIDESREVFAQAFGCLFAEVVFCSSGTEAANLAILGAALSADPAKRPKILLGAAEHHCVLNTAPLLTKLGFSVEALPVNREGLIDTEALERKLSADVLLVSVMSANNELGTIQPTAAIGESVKRHGALFHVDAVQTFPGSSQVEDWQADLVNVSAHKFYGPKAIGALFVRGGTKLTPISVGGTQEREIRAGTENVAGIVGAGVACRWMMDHRDEVTNQWTAARDAFEASLGDIAIKSVTSASRLPGHSHIRIPGIDAETMLIRLDREGVSASSGAACSSGSLEPSHVLIACGYPEQEAKEGLRFTFGQGISIANAEQAATFVKEAVAAILAKRS